MSTFQPLFSRMLDLGSQVRFRIASIALFFNSHGTTSKYKVSRQFIYNLRTEFYN